ncbi:protein gvpG [Halobellus salinus]|uniref:Protein gvpG n=1 Tax=Halobellus salinus TaxID=931585 RepID=A0A830EEY4_9EURY|nr:protein gvpG [Halobellus salinus]GGJ05391.1 protein gvpG [Halobellus salinus]SMP23340.1 hypothetical protein SAMN06265347_10948 [Halobellus salinus]
MFIIDDLLVKPFLSLVDIIHTMALDEMYDTDAIRDDIKENRLLYEVGERSEDEYQRRKQELEIQLELAQQIQEQMRGRVEIKQ